VYYGKRVCLSVCLCIFRQHISGSTRPILTSFMHVTYDRRSVLIWRPLRYAMHFRIMDDVTFARNGRERETRNGVLLKVTHQGKHWTDVYDRLAWRCRGENKTRMGAIAASRCRVSKTVAVSYAIHSVRHDATRARCELASSELSTHAHRGVNKGRCIETELVTNYC